ncbi:MAG TPA: FHA domain-containing protein [Kofleriaceae bacterium]
MEAWLVAVHRGPTGQRWQLPARGRVVIGRVSDAEVQLDDATVGRRHGAIRRTESGDVFEYWGASSGSSIDDRECPMGPGLALHDGAEIRIGGVYLRYFCGPDAGARTDDAVEQLAVIDSLTRVPFGDPPAAARITIRDIARLRERYGLIAIDQLHRQIAHRLATLAAGDAAITWTKTECFAIDPPEVAPRLVVEASMDTAYCNDDLIEFELVIE